MPVHFYQNKNVLITGGAGFIGSYLAKRFLKHNSRVFIADNLSTGSLDNLQAHPNLHFTRSCINDSDFAKTFCHIQFDLIVHLASVVGMKLATKQQQLVYKTATEGTQNVLKLFPGVPVILFSSSCVYGMEHRMPVSESQSIAYDQLLQYDGGCKGYACGKWEMEQIGLRAAEHGRKVMIVRPFNVIGYKQVSNYGMVVPTFIKLAIKGEPITIFDDGSQVRSFSCVEVFTDCLFKLMDSEKAWHAGHNIINIGVQKGSSINELAQIIIEETQSLSGIKYLPYKLNFPNHKDVAYRVPDTSLGEAYFGQPPWPSLQQIVRKILAVEKPESLVVQAS